MHRVARELAHQECGWKHSEGHGVVALDYEGVRHVGLDKMCLLMEVRLNGVLGSSPNTNSRKPACKVFSQAPTVFSDPPMWGKIHCRYKTPDGGPPYDLRPAFFLVLAASGLLSFQS